MPKYMPIWSEQFTATVKSKKLGDVFLVIVVRNSDGKAFTVTDFAKGMDTPLVRTEGTLVQVERGTELMLPKHVKPDYLKGALARKAKSVHNFVRILYVVHPINISKS